MNNRQKIGLRQCERGRVMHAGMASGLERRFDDDDDDDDLSHITLRSMSKYRLVMTSMIWMTLEMSGLTSMHHAPSFAALTSVVYLPTSKIIDVGYSVSGQKILKVIHLCTKEHIRLRFFII